MTDLNKRSAIKLVALSAIAAAALMGCSKKEEAKPLRKSLATKW
jgi:basic membrane protein A and related proteins